MKAHSIFGLLVVVALVAVIGRLRTATHGGTRPASVIDAFNTADAEDMGGLIWWATLWVVTVVNVLALAQRSQASGAKWLGHAALYVLVCGLRSVLPRVDVERVCMFDHPLSWPAVGRTGATVAELAFGDQLRRAILQLLNRSKVRSSAPRHMTNLAFVLLAIAECCSWYGVATLRQWANGVEESLWTVGIVLMAVAVAASRRAGPATGEWFARERAFSTGFLVCAIPFIAYMVLVDVPMYIERYNNSGADVEFLPFWQGVADSANCKSITPSMHVWREEIPWMTPYFSFCVWASIWLAVPPSFAGPSPPSATKSTKRE